jgi:hypothetical protein
MSRQKENRGTKMKRSLVPFVVLLFLGVFAVHFTVYRAYAADPVEGEKAATINNTKSNTYRQIQPNPEPQPTPEPHNLL